MTATPSAKLSSTFECLKAVLPLSRRTRIVDVGANPLVEMVPYAGLLAMGGCDVVGFEPQPDAFAALAKVKSERETYLPFAVGNGGSKELKIFQHSGFASVFEPYKPGLDYLGIDDWTPVIERLYFEAVPLDGSDLGGPIDLLKIDIQGGECDVFRGGEQSLMSAMAVIVELRFYPLYEGEPMMGGVDTELRRQGFVLHKLLPTKPKVVRHSQMHRVRLRRMRDQLLDGDAVYLRDLGQISAYSDEQLVHLCVTASTVFESHGVVLHCLDELVRRGAASGGAPSAYVDALPAGLRREEGDELSAG